MFFQTTRDPKLYVPEKKNSFEIPWPRAIKCPPNWNFMKPVLENRKKMPHLTVQCSMTYKYIQTSSVD